MHEMSTLNFFYVEKNEKMCPYVVPLFRDNVLVHIIM